MYYHLEYVGVPKSYKWQNTNNLVSRATVLPPQSAVLMVQHSAESL
jgi:hypothetical protein